MRRELRWASVWAFVTISTFSLLALAEEPADSRSAAFQAMEGARSEDVPGGDLLIYAYGFVLVSLVAYVARIGLVQRKTASDIDRLSAALTRQEKRG